MTDLGQQLRRIALLPDGKGASDRELLERFLASREEAAFEMLVRRHGPMVLGICRRVLRDEHLAEDAFQATFLILVSKAAAIRKRQSIGSWLFGVAYRTAAKAGVLLARRRAKERPMRDMPIVETRDSARQGLGPILDEEIARLSEIYQAPVILCDLQGKTRKEAARLLGCPEGTLSSRLMRARAVLAQRLLRRGVTLSAGALGAVLAQQCASAALSPTLLTATTHAATKAALGQAIGLVSPSVAALTKGVLKTMLWTHLTKCVALVMTAGLFGAGLVWAVHSIPAAASESEEQTPPSNAAQPPALSKPIPEAIREKLNSPVTLDKGLDNIPLKDAIEFFQDRYDVNIVAESERFNSAGRHEVKEQNVRLPPLYTARLGSLLQALANQVKGVCLASAEKLLIVPNDDTVIKTFVAEGYVPLPTAPLLAELEHQNKVLLLMIEAQDRTVRKLRSGIGSGIYEEYSQTRDDKKADLKVHAKFTLQFDHKRYYLDLLDKETRSFGRTIMISDNSAAYIAKSSGASQTANCEVRPEGLGCEDEFLLEPWQVPTGIFDLRGWLRPPMDDIRIEELPKGGYTLHIQQGKARVTWTILERFDWIVSNWKYEYGRSRSLDGNAQVVWKQSSGVWYLANIELTSGQCRRSLHFDDFKANVPISPKLFRLAALELPAGASIHDKREDRRAATYRYQPIHDDGTRRLFDMEAELESLGPP